MVAKQYRTHTGMMLRKSLGVKRLICALPVLALSAFVASSPLQVSAQSLADAVLIASERDPGVTAMRQQVARRGVDIAAARDERLPQLSLAADSGTTDVNGAGVTLTVSQVLYDWGRVKYRIDGAAQQRVKAVSDLKMAIEDITLEVGNFYLDIEVMDRKIRRTQEYLVFANRIAGHAQARADGGLGDNAEVARAQLEIARTEDRLQQLTSDRGLALAQIAFLLGRDPVGVSSAPELGFTSRYSDPGNVASAVQLSPDYVAAAAEVAAATAEVGGVRAARLPSIRLQAQGRVDLDGGGSRTAVGLSAGVDLNASNFRGRQLESARLQVEAARSNLEAVRRNLANSARSAVQQINVLRSSEQSQNQQLAEAQSVLDTFEQRFIGGQSQLLELLTTGRDLYDAQIDSIDTYDLRKRTEYQAARDLGVLGTLILANSRG